MRRYCKRVDIEDEGFCLAAVRDFLRGKSGRREVQALLDEYGGEEELARSLAAEIRERRVTVAPIQYFNRIEPINGKHRIIGRETPKHQCFDYIAVNGLAEMLMAKIGDSQTALVGFVFYTYKTTIRPGIFLRARRAFMLAGRSEVIPLPLARRCISYYGYLKHSCSKGVIEKYHAEDTFARCKDVVSLAETERRLDESLFDGGASGRGLPRAPGRLRGHQAAPQHPEGDARADRPCRRSHRGVAG